MPSEPCHSSCDLLFWNFLSWFQVRVALTLPQLYHHLCTDQMTGQSQSCTGFIFEANQTSLCFLPSLTRMPVSLHVSLLLQPTYQFTELSVFTCVCHTCSPVFPSLCPSSRLTESAHLPLSPRLSPCNLTWPLSLVFFRAWLVGWPTFGPIRVTYRSVARTDKCTHAHT